VSDLTAEERAWTRAVATDVAQEYAERAARLLLAVWPEHTDMHAIAIRLGQVAAEVGADSAYQARFGGLPDLATERVSQLHRQWTKQAQANRQPKIYAGSASQDTVVDAEVLDEEGNPIVWRSEKTLQLSAVPSPDDFAPPETYDQPPVEQAMTRRGRRRQRKAHAR
jgi:hypothetical protein